MVVAGGGGEGLLEGAGGEGGGGGLWWWLGLRMALAQRRHLQRQECPGQPPRRLGY